MTSDLVWDLVFVFENVAALRNSSLGASTRCEAQAVETGLFSQDVSGAQESTCFSSAYLLITCWMPDTLSL